MMQSLSQGEFVLMVTFWIFPSELIRLLGGKLLEVIRNDFLHLLIQVADFFLFDRRDPL